MAENERTPEKKAADQIMAVILKEYGETDDRVGEQLATLSRGDESVARNSVLLMAGVHLQGAMALWKAAGWSREKIAEELYTFADRQAAG